MAGSTRFAALLTCLFVGCGGSTPPSPGPSAHSGEQPVVAIAEPAESAEEPVVKAAVLPTNMPATIDTDWVPLLRERRPAPAKQGASSLKTEAAAFDRLLSATPRTSPDHAALLRRAAAIHLELAHASDAEGNSDQSRTSRQRAIELFTQFKTQYSGDLHIDEALYSMGLAQERLGDLTEARRSYFELVQKVPKSKFVPASYLAFGELFFQAAASDPSKYALAEQTYKEAVKYPPPDNWLYGYAHYQLGRVHAAEKDHLGAMSSLSRAIEFTAKFPALPHTAPLRQAATAQLVHEYRQAGRADRAPAFFQKVLRDPEQSSLLLVALASEYAEAGQLAEARTVASAVLRRGDPPCEPLRAVVAKLRSKATPASREFSRLYASRCPRSR